MLRTMVTDFLRHGYMTTTLAKAKELRPLVEKMITVAKKDDFNARRKADAYLTDKSVVRQLFTDVGPRYKDVNGGYTRIIKLVERAGDAAPMATILMVDHN